MPETHPRPWMKAEQIMHTKLDPLLWYENTMSERVVKVSLICYMLKARYGQVYGQASTQTHSLHDSSMDSIYGTRSMVTHYP